jgi:iron-sulfur cluster assembly protein
VNAMSEVISQNPASAPAPVAKPAAPIKFGITDAAVKRLQKLLVDRQTPDAGLRVAVKGGGCSGLAYSLEWAEKPRERDKIAERDGVRVFIDPKSYLYLMGTNLDFEETLMTSGFKLVNPNVKSSCGCGESFTI